MRVIRASLVGDARRPAPKGPVSVVHDLLWAHAVPTDGLEHIRVKSADHGMDVFLFMRAPSDSDALRQVCALLDRAHHPLRCQGYRVRDP
ncbi:hypothetical protein C3489_11010 [Streptomyces sp. Ru71]|uniref:hypothetical protein n=1 Tax=Streptomyces sp. Ru71 TaxID=2080746 RepID=UPI000CDD2F5A|nr:hypothetical protein [Streptomyces sp. Ru71]POX55313.1 hypothetical protein C3489_11010 [Streptomyces sp. Ru71]